VKLIQNWIPAYAGMTSKMYPYNKFPEGIDPNPTVECRSFWIQNFGFSISIELPLDFSPRFAVLSMIYFYGEVKEDRSTVFLTL
jgi:hypothetical protein